MCLESYDRLQGLVSASLFSPCCFQFMQRDSKPGQKSQAREKKTKLGGEPQRGLQCGRQPGPCEGPVAHTAVCKTCAEPALSLRQELGSSVAVCRAGKLERRGLSQSPRMREAQ